jgi:polyphosphate glucokinase
MRTPQLIIKEVAVNILGIDVGGSGIKGALVDTETGKFTTDRLRIDTPEGFAPADVLGTIARMVAEFDYQGPLGIGFPAVVMDGVVATPPTSLAYRGWVDLDVARRVQEMTGCPTAVLNDADAAGYAEMRFGNGRNEPGVVMVFTLGTGIGSALFMNSQLVPNTEMGRVYLRKKKRGAEHQAAERVRDEQDLSWKAWGQRLNDYFGHIELLFWPRLIIVGGGVSKKHKKFFKYIDVRAELRPARLRNRAGIVGAAMAALEKDEG